MNSPLPYGGQYYVADTSAWSRVQRDPTLAAEWTAAVQNDQISICAPVKFELLYVARTGADFVRVEELLSQLRDLPVNRGIIQAAFTALRELSQIQDRYHRVQFTDAIVAASAADRGVGVLHCDKHYERLKQVLEFETHWVC
jgi:predicted nucleic acid-binding protein